MTTWDPARYLRFADARTRPFVDLLHRVDVNARRIIDLGCGPGHLTRLLLERWPGAAVTGVDSSPQMIETARRDHADDRVEYVRADLREWTSKEPPDLLISNATYQWVPGHLDLLRRLADQVSPQGVFAFGLPMNHDAPSHTILRDLMRIEPYARHVTGVATPLSHEPVDYLTVLSRPGWRLDVWETTYLHVLHGPDPVFEWISGTGAREVLQALNGPVREEFVRTYKQRLEEAYPERPLGTVLPFRRGFVVASRED